MPTVAETLPGYEVTTWYGLMLPAGTPQGVRDKIQSAAVQAIGMAETRKRLEELGYGPIKDTPEEFARFLPEDIEKMANLIKQYNLKPE
jgi:tripartite-type tricarboxylate transporter receptor subunit TctC